MLWMLKLGFVSLFPWVFEVFLVLSICIYNIYIYISNN